MKKPWLIAGAVILVAAIAVIGVLLVQAGDLRKQTDELTAKVETAEKSLAEAKAEAAAALASAAEAEAAAEKSAAEKAEAEAAAAEAVAAAEKSAAEKAEAEAMAAEAAAQAEAAAAEVVAAMAQAQAEAAPAEPFVIKIRDTVVSVGEAQAYFDEVYNYYNDYYLNYGMALSAEEIGYIREEAINSLLTKTVMGLKVEEYGLGEISEEEVAEYKAESDINFEQGLTDIMNYYGYSRDEALEALESYGITQESEFETYLTNVPFERLVQYVTRDIAVSQEDIEAEYAAYVESDKATYENDVATYELYTNYYGSQSFYMPTGYRMVKHILLEIPEQIAADMIDYQTDISAAESVLAALTDELAALENEAEGEEDAAPRAPEEIQADIDAKKAELAELNEKFDALQERILPELQAQIDEIMGKLEGGASFDSLIQEYGKDPGALVYMDGYLVHTDSVIWDVVFRDTAMGLEKIGDVSRPVLTDFGVHIIQYAADAPSGAVPITEEISEAIREGLQATVRDEALSVQLQAWLSEYDLEMNADLIVLPEAQEAPEGDAGHVPDDDSGHE